MKKILQALDGASTKPVEGTDSMSKFLKIVTEGRVAPNLGGYTSAWLEQIVVTNTPKNGVTPKQALQELKTRVGSQDPHNEAPSPEFVKKYLTKKLEEGATPHKVSLPVQMAMQHYQQPKKEKLEEVSVFRTYVAVVEDELQTQQSERKQLMRQYGQRIAESVLKKNVSERVTIGPDGQVTGGFKPTAPSPNADPVADKPATPVEKPAPLSSRYDPRLKQTGDAYTIDVGGKQYKFAGRGTPGPGTGEVIKVPGGNVGIRGLAPVSVELGNDGMYYVAPKVDESKDTVKVPVTQKPRQGPLRPQTGAGAHKDKKKDQKQGKEKHKKPFYELADVESLEQTLSEIKKGQKDSNGFTKCWPGKHAEGTKKGKNGKPVRNCVPNESIDEAVTAAQQAAIAIAKKKKAGKK